MTRALACALLALGSLHCARGSQLEAPDAGSDRGGRGGSSETAAGAGPGGNGGAGAAAVGGSAGASGMASLPPLLDAEALLAASCYDYVEPTELLPANILFLLDRSASMECNPPPLTDSATCELTSARASLDAPSKWEIVQSALIESLTILSPRSRVGLSYFNNDGMCGVQAAPTVPLARNSGSQQELIKASLSISKPAGPTPLVGATILAYRHLHELAQDQFIRGATFVVLLTDGKQSDMCADPSRCATAEECTELLIEEEVPKASGAGVWIRTFVVGVPGSEADSRTLSRIALRGGTSRAGCDPDRDCHFDVSSGAEFSLPLRQALQNIVGQTRSCDLPAPRPESGNLDRLNILYTPTNGVRTLVRQDPKPCEGANGWQYAENQTRIRLCGDVCRDLQGDPEGQLQVVIGCPIQGPE